MHAQVFGDLSVGEAVGNRAVLALAAAEGEKPFIEAFRGAFLLGIVEFADQGDVVAGHSLHDVGEKTGVFFQQNLEGSLIQAVEDAVCLCVDAERDLFL